jgi:Na+/H+ antiporter NhaA
MPFRRISHLLKNEAAGGVLLMLAAALALILVNIGFKETYDAVMVPSSPSALRDLSFPRH